MKVILFIVFSIVSVNTFSQSALSVEKIMQDPKWIGSSPSGIFWSADDKSLFFRWNPHKQATDSAYVYTSIEGRKQLKTVENKFYEFEKAASEGIFNKKKNSVVFEFQGDLFLRNLEVGNTIRITQTLDKEWNPHFTDKDQAIIFQKDNLIETWNFKDGTTKDKALLLSEDKSLEHPMQSDRMQSDWLRKNELQTSQVLSKRLKNKIANDTWSPDTLYLGQNSKLIDLAPNWDGTYIALIVQNTNPQIKGTQIPDYITESGYVSFKEGRSKVGRPEEPLTLLLYTKENGKVLKINTASLPGINRLPAYLKDYNYALHDSIRPTSVVGAYWNPEGSRLLLDIRSLDFKDRWIALVGLSDGSLTSIDHERDEAWIGGPGIEEGDHNMINWINQDEFYYRSEESGYAHLYLHNITQGTTKKLTHGHFEIQDVSADSTGKYFYVLANKTTPGSQNWFRFKTNHTENFETITKDTGLYEIIPSHNLKEIAYRYSTQVRPWELFVTENIPGSHAIELTNKAASPEFLAYPWRKPEIFTYRNEQNEDVYARIYQPKADKKNHAAILFIHGAGYLQDITTGWSYYFREMMFNNLLADLGFVVMEMDYRASSGYGRNWRTAIYRHMGGSDLQDVKDAAKYLIRQQDIDSNRIGIYGGSYGGFITLMALFTAPDVFHAGAALRPVTDWGHYNHEYTAEILNTPQLDSLSYQRSSPIYFASGLKQPLLICHGMLDDNVEFQDVVRLNQRLIELNKKNWQIALYPMEKHDFKDPTSWTDEYRRILNLFELHLSKKN